MGLTIRRFWFLSNQVDRLRSEQDLRQIQLLASVGSVEAYKHASEHLKSQTGQVYVWAMKTPTEIVVDPDTGLDPEFNREGLRALKMKIASGR